VTPMNFPQLDFSPLADLPNVYRQGQMQRAREMTLAELGRGGLDANTAMQRLAAGGDMQGAMTLANIGNMQQQRALQERAIRLQEEAARERPTVTWQEDATGNKVPYLVHPYGRGIQRLQIEGGASQVGGFAAPSPGAPAQTPIPPPPPGANPKVWIKEQTEAQVKAQTAQNDLIKGGKQVLGMVDQLEAKTYEKPFAESVGPFRSALHDQPVWSPGRLGYEILQNSGNKTYLDKIKQDAQAINTFMQRALLKGDGPITENERSQINEILGRIVSARSPDEARQLLDNFRGIVQKLFQMGALSPATGIGANVAAPGGGYHGSGGATYPGPGYYPGGPVSQSVPQAQPTQNQSQPQPTQNQSQPQRPVMPEPGDVMDGYRYKGGNRADPNSWVKL